MNKIKQHNLRKSKCYCLAGILSPTLHYLKGAFSMTDFIRKLCESNFSESYKPYTLPDEVQEHIRNRKIISEKLQKNIGDKNFELFEEYVDLSSCIQHEENCYAFSCGMKFVIRMLFGVFFKE